RLVRLARNTSFGRDHDFARIRSVEDYRANVPPRDYETFWQQYWQKPFPFLANVTWPTHIPYFALSSGTTTGTTKYIPISPQMLASNRRAATTMLAFLLSAFPKTPLFTGRIFFLGGSTDLRDLSAEANVQSTNGTIKKARVSALPFLASHQAKPVLAGDLSAIATREVSDVIRPYTFPTLELALIRDWEKKMLLLAEQSAKLPITLIGGVPSWLLVFFEKLKQVTGKSTIAEVWPTLNVVVHGGTNFDPYRTLFAQTIGNEAVHYLDIFPASEGFIATEDPRHGLLRLIPDNQIFFEFVPVEELGQSQPTRHTVADLEPGVQYAVLLTTCAGLWSYILGDTVCFEKRDPPLLRFTGRTKYFLSAFGEHLISEEVERAVTMAAEQTQAAVVDFHVGPLFPDSPSAPGRHLYFMEFAQTPSDLAQFTTGLDQALCRINEDYEAHRKGDLTMLAPEVRLMPRGGFTQWMRSKGKLGGQHKVPRMDNSGAVTRDLCEWLKTSAL
ncbi:MAG TPA: GH3 auxin-responsive promoter family protein, partial [Gemmataceae bacterium]|nr:GH3 auxin-responsive promoter family protein [Gemmataceae bacterium]